MKNINELGELVLKKVQISLCLVDGNGEVIFANEAALEFLNKREKEIKGLHIHDIVHGSSSDHKKDHCPLIKPIKDNKPILREPDIFYNSEGKGSWAEFSSYPLLKGSEFKGILISFLNAAVSMKSDQALLEHQAKFKAVFTQALYPKMILDSTGEILESNRASRRIFGESIENTMLFDYFTPLSQKKVKEFWGKFMPNEHYEERIEVTVNDSNAGKKKYVFDFSATKDIQPNMHLLTLLDVTEEYYEQEAQNQFISVASHELKTPLAVIKAYSELLQRKYKDDGAASQYVNKIQEKVDVLTRLINAMVDETKLGAGKLEFNNQQVIFGKFVEDVVDELQKAYHHHKLALKGKSDSIIELDPERISQVISNLVSNASKYSEKGKDIVIMIEDDNDRVQVGVKDYGPGIPKKEQPQLFKAFYRSPSAHKKKYPGLGLGLFIAKQIVNHYGGDVWIESKWSQGSTFYFTLPKK